MHPERCGSNDCEDAEGFLEDEIARKKGGPSSRRGKPKEFFFVKFKVVMRTCMLDTLKLG